MSLNNLTFNSNETFKNDLTQLESVWINKNMIRMFDVTKNEKKQDSHHFAEYYKSLFLVTEDDLLDLDFYLTLDFMKRRIHLNLYFYEQIFLFLDRCGKMCIDDF